MADQIPADTPSLAKVIKDAIEARLMELHTCLPATIESYDAATGFASVSPCLKRKYANGDLVDLPVINGVPVVFPRGGGAVVTFNLVKGDEVILVFSERSLDAWKTTGGKTDPGDPRKHALSDCYAIPGGTSKANPPSAATVTLAFTSLGLKVSNATGNVWFKDNADISFDTGTVQGLFGNGGKVSFTNSMAELIATLVLMFQDIQAATTVTMLGPEPLVMATFATHLANLQSFQA